MMRKLTLSMLAGWGFFGLVAPAKAQPFDLFESPSGELCGAVNAANAFLVVFSDTGELVDVTELPIVFLPDTFVDEFGNVFIRSLPAGFIDFFIDGDGFESLFWVFDESEEVVELDADFFPFPSGFFPEEFVDNACIACPLWDEPIECDEDLDEVPDEFDLCPGTPLDVAVDDDGCEFRVVRPAPVGPVFFACGGIGAPALVMMLAGLAGLSLMRRR